MITNKAFSIITTPYKKNLQSVIINRFFKHKDAKAYLQQIFIDENNKITKARFKYFKREGKKNIYRLDGRSIRYMEGVKINET
jgi:hypothetical protein